MHANTLTSNWGFWGFGVLGFWGRPRKSAARVFDFFAHHGRHFESGEGEGELRPEIHCVPIPVRDQAGQREVRPRSMAKPDEERDRQKDQQRKVGADATRVLQPLADVQAHDVENDRYSQ